MVDALVLDACVDPHQLAERHQSPRAARDLQFCMRSRSDRAGAVEPHRERHVLLRRIHVQQPRRIPGGGHLHGARDVVLGDAVQRGLLLVDQHAVLRLVVLDVPVDVHHAVGVLPNRSRICRAMRDPALLRRPVDLRHQRLQHRRTGRHLRHLDARAVSARRSAAGAAAPALAISWLCSLRSPFGSRFTWMSATFGAAPQVVMAHQSVEVVRRRRAHIRLHVHHFGLLRASLRASALRHPRGLFERGAVRHVDDHLELALVVERQHLHLDELEVEQRHRAEQQEHDAAEEAPAQWRAWCSSAPITRR